MRIDHVDARDLVLEQLRRRAAIALEGELHVLGGERIAVVKDDALAQDELVAEPVLRHGPRLGERRRHAIAGHGLHQRVVQGVEDLHERDDAGVLRGIEPRGGQGDVHRPRHLLGGRHGNEDQERGQDQDLEREGASHHEGLLSDLGRDRC
jgi:hypothetical protein